MSIPPLQFEKKTLWPGTKAKRVIHFCHIIFNTYLFIEEDPSGWRICLFDAYSRKTNYIDSIVYKLPDAKKEANRLYREAMQKAIEGQRKTDWPI